MIPVFCYHSVSASPLSISPAIFEEQIRTIKRAGLTTLTLSQLVTLKHPDQIRAVVLTFDDCFLDVYENAVPILRDSGCVATFFPVPGYDGVIRWGSPIERRWSDVRSGTYTIPYSYMGAFERRELVGLGMEVGAHTLRHANLDSLSAAECREELMGSKEYLEMELGTKVVSFCYPRGRYTPENLKAVQNSGFHLACTTKSGYFHSKCNPYELPRFAADSDTEIFRNIILGKGMHLPLHRRAIRKTKRWIGRVF